MRCQGPLRRRSVTCSRAALDHNRYFCLSCATLAPARLQDGGRGSSAWLASVLMNASSCSCKKGENRRAIALHCCNTRIGTQTLAELQRYHRTQP